MGEDALSALEAQLRTRAPSGIAGLESDHLMHLADSVQAARRRQAAELAAAGEQALGHVPRLLRGPIRKIVG